MKEQVLVLIKPDGMKKALMGYVLMRLAEARLEIVASRMVKVSPALAAEHYKHLRGKSFFRQLIKYLSGDFHQQRPIMALVYRGENAIKKCRDLAGATNPEEASSRSIRGVCGRITTKGIFENVLHVSSNKKEAKREIKLWFQPEECLINLFPVRIKTLRSMTRKVWA